MNTNPNNAAIPTPVTQWRTVAALAERLNAGSTHPTFSEFSLRHHIRNASHNGLKPAIKRLGRKILIDEGAFIAWLDSRGGA